MEDNKKICRCRNISYLDIKNVIKSGARDIEDIIELTGAATCCGGCTSEVLTILESNLISNNDNIK